VRLFRRKPFKPPLKISVQTALIVIYKHACRNVHGIHKAQALAYAALSKRILNLRRYVHISAASFGVKIQFLAIRFHFNALKYKWQCRKFFTDSNNNLLE
jgi:hypothetical protein